MALISFVLVVRLADPSMLSWQAVVGPPRALPLRRYWLWVKASPEFPLWRYCQYLVWLHQRLNTLCVVDSSIPLAARVPIAATIDVQSCKSGTWLRSKM